MTESNLQISFARNIVLTINLNGEEKLNAEDLGKIQKQFNRWMAGLKEALDKQTT